MKPVYRQIRQSTLGSFDICPARAQYDVAGLSGRSWSEPAMLGTAYHAALEVYYQSIAGGEVHPSPPVASLVITAVENLESQLEDIEGVFEWDTSYNQAVGMLEAMLTTYFDEGHYWQATPDQVLGVEWQFTEEFIPGWKAHGTVDLLLRKSPTELIMVDHKTTGRMWSEKKASPRQNNQAAWYVKWIKALFPGTTNVDVYFDVMRRDGRKFSRFYCPVRDVHETAVTRKAESVAGLLDLGVALPPNPTTPLCSEKFCDSWNICPYGAELDL